VTNAEVEVLASKLDGISENLVELKVLAKQTNGRVTELERHKIANDAAEAARSETHSGYESRGRRKYDQLSPIATGTFLVALGAALGHFL
jgi:hypothetical protein